MLDLDTRKLSADAAGVATSGFTAAKAPKPLSPAAHNVAAQPIAAAYSPIVLAGTVRLIEFALVMLVGTLVYASYVVPIDGFEWHYLGAILAVAVLAMLAFQAADIYQVQAFRGYEKQYFRLASAWSVVFLLDHRRDVLRQERRRILPRMARQLLRDRTGDAVAFRRALFLKVRQWTRAGRLDRRTVIVGADTNGDALIKSLAAQRDSDVRSRRRIRRPRRRPRATRAVRLSETRQRRRSGRIRPPHPRRSRDLLAADLGRKPHPADAQEALGAAGRHPARRAYQQAAVPPARLLLYRQRAGARRLRQADHRLGRRDEMAVRQNRRQPHRWFSLRRSC